jgi:hypothetical protein
MVAEPALRKKESVMYRDQNNQLVEAGNGRRYAFGLGAQKQPVRLRYDVDADELVVAFGRSNEWSRASEFTGFTFAEIDTEGVEIPIAEPTDLFATRLQQIESEAFKTRIAQMGLVHRLRSLVSEFRQVTDKDEFTIRQFVYEGIGSVEQLVDSFTKQTS